MELLRRAPAVVLCFAAVACAPAAPPPRFAAPVPGTQASGTGATAGTFHAAAEGPPREVGQATWYGKGKKTANGEPFDPSAMTAAHRTLPFGTWVEVRRRDSGRVVRVRINDRGPFGDPRRIIDVSRGAAEVLDFLAAGVVPVELRIVSGP